MSETVALFRLAIARHRVAAMWLLVSVLACQAIALLATLVPQVDGESAAVGALLALLPAGIASLMLFDYGQTKNMNGSESGCDDWLLRLPIASWKIACPPIVLKTLWVVCVWCMFAVTAGYLGLEKEHIGQTVGPGICFTAGMIWVLFLAWRPFRSGWWRILLLMFMVPAIYITVGLVVVAAQAEYRQWYPWALLASVLIYAAGVWATVRAVELARTHAQGIVPAGGKSHAVSAAESPARREHASASRALVWHDLLRTRGFVRYAMLLGVVPAVIIFPLLIPLHAVTVLGAVIVFLYIGAIAMCGIGGSSSQDLGNMLPPYLAASPLKTSTIAWTRMGTIVCGTLVMWSFILLVFAGWACWPENREVWYKWATERAIDAEVPLAGAFSIGVRWSVAIVLAAVVFLLSRFIAYLWAGMVGRQWFSGVVGVAIGVWLLLVLGVILRWFMQQTDWEGTMLSLYSWLQLVPAVVVGLLIVKAIGVVSATLAVARSQLATTKQITVVYAIWAALTLSVAVTLAMLIPDPRATLLWCLAAATLSIPLSRVLILPVSLSFNRHR